MAAVSSHQQKSLPILLPSFCVNDSYLYDQHIRKTEQVLLVVYSDMIERYFYIIEYCTLICTLIDSIIVLTETEKMPNPNLSTVEIQPILLFVL